MKFYKSLQLLLILCLVASCSTDADEQQNTTDPEVKIAQSQFDSSHLGVYKGLFTTNDGLTRGSVEVTLTPTNEGIAKITLSSGEQIELKSSRVKLTVDNNVSNLRFSSEGLSAVNVALEFSVNGNGAQPVISNVSFDNQESDILIAKNLSRAPLTPITGTYIRTSGTGAFAASERTWNIMSIGEGNDQNFAVQVVYDGTTYNTPVANSVQSNCSDGSGATTCDIDGVARVAGFNIAFTGTHTYSLGSAQCSGVSGTWALPAYGNSAGTFTSDVDAGDCIVVGSEEEVIIGTQTWTLKNLDVVTYRNGDAIPQVQDPADWQNLTTGAWCYYNNDSANNDTYGKLYNWYAISDPRGLAPEGYHIPDADEYITLRSFLGTDPGGKLKAMTGWDTPNVGATNESGFTALPGGRRIAGSFFSEGAGGYFLGLNSSTPTSPTVFILSNVNTNFSSFSYNGNLDAGSSVRCVKD